MTLPHDRSPATRLLTGALALAVLISPAHGAARDRDRDRDEPPVIANPGDWLAQWDPPEEPPEPIGQVTYFLNGAPDNWPDEKRARIIKAMDEAVWLYNQYGHFRKQLRVQYKASVPTADGNINGQIRFGKSISTKTALHEISHTLGIGTARRWDRMFEDKQWQGQNASRLLKAFDGPEAVLRGDKSHFWPYGLNHQREDGPTNRLRHVMMVEAMARDMGLRVFATEQRSR